VTRALLTLNAGSSSLKVALYPAQGDEALASGLVDRIGPSAQIKLKDARGRTIEAHGDLTSHAGAIAAVFAGFRRHWPDLALEAIGHRVVHGGPNRADARQGRR
jgi:acetate kinase